ncbi:hypothetical protein [Streptomyces geranii]|uniref:hypothetical protein n=1 Tax=Streptomyces geranii TaxID=2058923 RepID=UPI000D034B77|nr:hypothetical protein [Streptomyces geranii]
MDHDHDHDRDHGSSTGIGTGIHSFVAEFHACHAEFDEFTTQLLMDYDFGERPRSFSQAVLARRGDLYELRSTHRFGRVDEPGLDDPGVVDLYAALSIGPRLCVVEVGVEVDLDLDLGAVRAGTRTPYHWKREGIPFGEALTVLRERTRALMKVKDPFGDTS